MKTVGLSKMGLNSTAFYRNLLNIISMGENMVVENVVFNRSYDFILLDGGSDVTPSLYGEENKNSSFDSIRDSYEMDIFFNYKDTPTKFVGICRGLQFLNVMYGGTLYQNLRDYDLGHHPVHEIEICSSVIKFLPHYTSVNSLHHQGIKTLGKGLLPIAYDVTTRVIEIIGDTVDRIRAVQFHPEFYNSFPYTKEILRWLFWFH